VTVRAEEIRDSIDGDLELGLDVVTSVVLLCH
jgi:hypothetical protein